MVDVEVVVSFSGLLSSMVDVDPDELNLEGFDIPEMDIRFFERFSSIHPAAKNTIRFPRGI